MVMVLSVGVAAMMLGMSGFTAAWGAPAPQTDAAVSELNRSNENFNASDPPVEGPVSSTDSSFIGLLTSGLQSVVDVAAAVVVLPLTLINLGFPAWFSVPLGLLAQFLTAVGVVQFATKRDWK